MKDENSVAFYAPLKSPDHPAPSGDRTMGRLLLSALTLSGLAPTIASSIRTYEPVGDPARQTDIRDASRAESDRLIQAYEDLPLQRRPRLWFTYHCYYKAPDWIGPPVADALGIPYVVAEGSRAGKRRSGPWELGNRGAEAALDRADIVFVMTPHDGESLARYRPGRQLLVDLPPFLDAGEWPRPEVDRARRDGPLRLVTVAMMREGDKLASFRILAAALRTFDALQPADRGWRLVIVGDGPARPKVETLFEPFAGRVAFRGRIDDRLALADAYSDADLLVWPAVNEAYGMVLMEAQAMGCPVLAGHYGGVGSAMRVGETGWLTPPGDPDALARALAQFAADPSPLARASSSALDFVRGERDLGQAADTMRGALTPLLERLRAA